MRGDFWYPYAGLQDAANRLRGYADKAIGPTCGVVWSDGRSVALLRADQAPPGQHGVYLNVLRREVSAPRPAPPPYPSDSTFLRRAEQALERVLETVGEGEAANEEVQRGASEAALGAVRDHVWEPAHEFLLRHKKIADGVGVGVDVLGVVAGLVFIAALSPAIGTVAVVAGGLALAGSGILLVADSLVFFPEVSGHEGFSKKMDDSPWIETARIVGTGMTLVDVPVGGVRAVMDVGEFATKARASIGAAQKTDVLAEAARARVAKISNPLKHPSPVQRRLHKVKVLALQADAQRLSAQQATTKMHWVAGRDVGASFVGTPAGTALLVGAPPSIILSQAQKRRDEAYQHSLEPAGGMPADVKLEMRTSAVQRMHRP